MSDIQAERAAALVKARDQAVATAESRYRLAVFHDGAGNPFDHIVRAPLAMVDSLRPLMTLCRGMATIRTDALSRLDLSRVDCLSCLDAFTELHRPAR